MRHPTLLIQLLVALCAIVGCGGGGGNGAKASGCSVLNAKVFGGERCEQGARSPVVALFSRARVQQQLVPLTLCTGSLVTVDDIITSAHCFFNAAEAAQQLNVELVDFVVVAGGAEGEVIRLVNAAVHPAYDGSVASPFDVAMATLERVPTPPIGPLPILVSEFTAPGSRLTAFGYGTNTSGEIGELKAADFSITEVLPGNLLVIGDGGSSICPGDSGGPAIYLNRAGVASLTAINSFGRGQCVPTAADVFGFADLQYPDMIEFILSYAPDVALG